MNGNKDKSGMSPLVLVGGGLVVAAVLGLMLFVSGVFDGTSPEEEDPTGLSSTTTELSGPEAGPPSSGAPFRPVGVAAYDGDADASTRESRARAGERVTGIEAYGRVIDANGTPVAKAQVKLIRNMVNMGQAASLGKTLAAVETSAGGSYRFRDLPQNDTYIIEVQHEMWPRARAFPVDPRQPESLRQDFRLDRGVGLSGFVRDDEGLPIAGAEVRVWAVDGVSAQDARDDAEERIVESDQEGRFQFSALSAGVKRIIATADGFAANGQSNYMLGEGGSPELVLVLSGGHTIRGIVVDEATGAPLAGAFVQAQPRSMLRDPVAGIRDSGGYTKPDRGEDPDELGGGGRRSAEAILTGRRLPIVPRGVGERSFLVRSATTDESGSFELTGVMRARYSLRVVAEGYYENRTVAADADEVSVRVPMKISAAVAGQVVDAETGRPISDFRVAVLPQPNPMFLPRNLQRAYSDPRGEFLFDEVSPGEQHLFVMAEGYSRAHLGPLTVVASQQISGVTVAMERGAVFVGRVTDDSGAALAGAKVTISEQSTAASTNPFHAIIRQRMAANLPGSLTEADGSFEITGVAEGQYLLEVAHPDYQKVVTPTYDAGPRGKVDVGAIVMPAGGTVKGIVTLLEGEDAGNPDPLASLTLRPVNPPNPLGGSPGQGIMQPTSFQAQTNAQGEYVFRGVPPGEYIVMALRRNNVVDFGMLVGTAQGGTPAGTRIVVSEGGVAAVDF